VYLYELVNSSWLERGVLRAPVPVSEGWFGISLAMSDTQLVVGEQGTKRAYVYRRSGATWTLQSTFANPETVTESGFATGVAVWNGQIAIGDRTDDPSGLMDAGAVYTATVSPTFSGGDVCSDALPLTLGTMVGCTQTASRSIGNVTTCGNVTTTHGPDIWYRFAPECDGNIIIDTVGSTFDTLLSVHSGCPSGTNTTSIACNDDGGFAAPNQRASLVTFNYVGGQVYFVRVAGYSGASGEVTLRSAATAGVPNDNCTSATTIGLGSRAFNTCAATTPVLPVVPLGSSRDVWYRFLAPSAGSYRFDTCGSSFDTVVTLFQGSQANCPTSGAALIAQNDNNANACNPSGSSLQGLVTVPLAASQSVLIRVGGANANAFGAGTLNVSNVGCSSIDFNNDGLFPDDNDLVDFLNVLAGGTCSNDPFCNDIDFNNDGLFPDDNDLVIFLRVLAGGDCS
jgi:hypothetical protein